MSNKIIEVQNIKVNITNIDDNDYSCISDFGKYKEGKSKADDIIRNWLRNRITLELLGTWELIYNPNFNSVEFDGFRKSAGLHTFTLSVTEWCEKTNNNYLIHTDAIKNYILPDNDFYKNKEWLKYVEEADILNVIIFNTTAKKWRELNPILAKNSNVRDYASINELTVLSNLESHNAELIKEGKSKEERFEILSEIAKYQLEILNNAERIKLLGDEIKRSKKVKNWSFSIDNDKLIKLVLEGKKTATSSLYGFDKIPVIGEESIIRFNNEKDACIVKTIDYKILKFNEMTEELAKLEGEGDLSLNYWKQVHLNFFKSVNPNFKEDDKIIFEIFKVTKNLVQEN